MNKLLSILSSVGLIASASTSVISCGSKKFDGIEPSVDSIMNNVTFKVNLDFNKYDDISANNYPYKIVRDDDASKQMLITRFYVVGETGDRISKDLSQAETFITFSLIGEKTEANQVITYDLVSAKGNKLIKKIRIKIPHNFTINSRMIVNAYEPSKISVELDDWTALKWKWAKPGDDDHGKALDIRFVELIDKDGSPRNSLISNTIDKNFTNDDRILNIPVFYNRGLDKTHQYAFKIYHWEEKEDKNTHIKTIVRVNDYAKLVNFLFFYIKER